MNWLRRSFLAGLVVTVPLLITVVTLVWTFRVIDGVARPLSEYFFGRETPGLGVLMTKLVEVPTLRLREQWSPATLVSPTR